VLRERRIREMEKIEQTENKCKQNKTKQKIPR
jgi:hypothetical protein